MVESGVAPPRAKFVAGVLAPAAGGGKADACCSEASMLVGAASAAGDGTAVWDGATTGWGWGAGAGLAVARTGAGGTG